MKRAIIIDDEPLVHSHLAHLLDWNSLGYELVAEGYNGLEGERLIQKYQPDLVLTDVVMPGKNGMDMIRDLQGKTEARFIVLSGYQDFQYVRQALLMNVTDYVLKPVTEQDLTLAIRRAESRQTDAAMPPAHDNRVVAQILQLALEHMADSNLTLKRLCNDYLFMNENYISRLFQRQTGEKFNLYMTRCRMEAAKEMLIKHPDCTIGAVAQRVGFDADGKYFSEVFRKYTGMTPGAYRKRQPD